MLGSWCSPSANEIQIAHSKALSLSPPVDREGKGL